MTITINKIIMSRTYKMETQYREYQSLPEGVQEGFMEVASKCSQEYHVRVCQVYKQEESFPGEQEPASLKAGSTSRQWWARKRSLQSGGVAVILIQRQEPQMRVRRQKFCSGLHQSIHLTWSTPAAEATNLQVMDTTTTTHLPDFFGSLFLTYKMCRLSQIFPKFSAV